MIDNEVSFVLRLYDEFDGALINDVGVRFAVNGVITRPILKKTGFYVFCGGVELPAQVRIERAHYQPAELTVPARDADAAIDVQHVRLLRQAPGIWRDCVWITAEVPADTDVVALSTREAFKIHAAGEEDGMAQITLAAATFAPLPGRRFCASTDAADDFLVLRMLMPGHYECDRLPKAGTKGAYVRAFCSRSDNEGHVAVPVEGGDSQPVDICYRKGAKQWDRVSATELC
jgi:hypothetical protein